LEIVGICMGNYKLLNGLSNLFNTLWKGLRGKPRLIQVIVGQRQVGKTTLALQVYGRR